MCRILEVEDEEHIADGLRFNLEAEGHTVEVASTGEDALARLAGGGPVDLLVLDVMLPGRDGFSVARRAILADVWGLSEGTDTRAIDNFVVRLRRYIEDRPASPKHLLTVRGVGYRFVPEP